jgi:hypothetical protein
MAAAPKMIRTKTPGVFKRGSRYVVTFRDADGHPRKEATRTYDLARALKTQRESEVAQGAFLPAGKLTFHDFAREWIESYNGKRQGIRPRTKADYLRDLEGYARSRSASSPRAPWSESSCLCGSALAQRFVTGSSPPTRSSQRSFRVLT